MVRRRGHRFAAKDHAPLNELGACSDSNGTEHALGDRCQGTTITWRFVARTLPAGMAFGCVLACAV